MKLSNKLLWGSLIALGPILFSIFLFYAGMLITVEDQLIDFRYKNFNPGHKISDKIVLIDIDEDSLALYANSKIFGRWPWKRNVYPQILEQINMGQPKAILYDILFTEQSEFDQELSSIHESMPISHAVAFRKEEEVKIDEIPGMEKHAMPVVIKENSIRKYNRAAYPVGIIVETTPFVHGVTFHEDADGIARHSHLFFEFGGKVYPSLSMVGLNALEKIKSVEHSMTQVKITTEKSNYELPLERGSFRLHYYPKSEIDKLPHRYSVGAIIADKADLDSGKIDDPTKFRVNPEKFKDKIVIIGTSAAATHDTKLLPYGSYPGVNVHILTLANILDKLSLKYIPEWISILFVVVMTLATVYLMMVSQNMVIRIVLPVLIIAAYISLAMALFKYDVSLNLSIFSISYPISFVGAVAYLSFTEGAERRKYSKVLGNMVDPTIVKEALNDLEALKAGGEKEITAFFSDVAGFSNISEQLSSKDLAGLLNEYLSAMTIILKHNSGTLDKYIGDAIVGIFGAPIDRKEHYLEAARASLQMIERLKELKVVWKEQNAYCKDAQDMDVRIGLNTGIAKVGFMGTDALASYTMMGDTVNLAARLEAAGKDYGVNILISQFTNEKVKSEMFTRELDLVRVKGKSEPVHLYELISTRADVQAYLKESTELYEEGFKLYLNMQFANAIKKFEESIKAKGKKDKSALMLIERCELYVANPPPENWDGVFTRTHK